MMNDKEFKYSGSQLFELIRGPRSILIPKSIGHPQRWMEPFFRLVIHSHDRQFQRCHSIYLDATTNRKTNCIEPIIRQSSLKTNLISENNVNRNKINLKYGHINNVDQLNELLSNIEERISFIPYKMSLITHDNNLPELNVATPYVDFEIMFTNGVQKLELVSPSIIKDSFTEIVINIDNWMSKQSYQVCIDNFIERYDNIQPGSQGIFDVTIKNDNVFVIVGKDC